MCNSELNKGFPQLGRGIKARLQEHTGGEQTKRVVRCTQGAGCMAGGDPKLLLSIVVELDSSMVRYIIEFINLICGSVESVMEPLGA